MASVHLAQQVELPLPCSLTKLDAFEDTSESMRSDGSRQRKVFDVVRARGREGRPEQRLLPVATTRGCFTMTNIRIPKHTSKFNLGDHLGTPHGQAEASQALQWCETLDCTGAEAQRFKAAAAVWSQKLRLATESELTNGQRRGKTNCKRPPPQNPGSFLLLVESCRDRQI